MLVDFEGDAGDELTVRMGDVVVNVTKAGEEGWLAGELRGKRGIFPANFAKVGRLHAATGGVLLLHRVCPPVSPCATFSFFFLKGGAGLFDREWREGTPQHQKTYNLLITPLHLKLIQ